MADYNVELREKEGTTFSNIRYYLRAHWDNLDGKPSSYNPASHNHDGVYVKEGGTSFSGEYPVVVRVGANNIYSDADISFVGASSTLKVTGDIQVAGQSVVKTNDSRLSDARTPLSHTLTSHSDVTINSPTSGQVLKWNGSAWVNSSDIDTDTNNYLTGVSGSGNGTVTFTRQGLTNLTWDGSHTHSLNDLSNVSIGTPSVNAVLSWNGTSWGSSVVPSHTHTIANVTGLQTALDGKAATSHNHTIANVTGLQTALDGKLGISAKAADSNLLDGLDLHTGRNNEANKVVRTNSSGYADFGWINTTSGNTTNASTDYYVNTNDGYIRKKTLANVRTEVVTSSAVTTALGFTPYNSTNPNGYITSSGSITGNAATATKLATARTIGGVSFDGTANINLPGVNTTGNQNTTGSAASLTTARTINGTGFNGTSNITTANWGTSRTITIGGTGKSVNGSTAVSWSLAEIGAEASFSKNTGFNKNFGTTAGTVSEGNHTHNSIVETRNSDTINFWVGTEAQYTALGLGSYSSNTLYIIT